jgi:predicted Zn-dependent protease
MIKPLSLFFVVALIFGQNDKVSSLLASAESFMEKLDDKNAYEKYEAVLAIDAKNIDALNGAARALSNLGHLKDDTDEKLKLFNTAVNYAEQATKLYPENDRAHYELATALGRVSQNVGSKERIRLSKEIKKEAEICVKINPNHDGALHILGKWHYGVSDLSWVEKTVADAVLGGVPKGASFENARNAFKKAIEIAPDRIHHLVELGRTYIALDDEENAKKTLAKVIKMSPRFSGDEKYITEAKEMLEDL